MKLKTKKESVIEILDKLGCSIDAEGIEACHWVSQNYKTVIVKFSRRKDWQKDWNKKKLKNHKMEDLGLP